MATGDFATTDFTAGDTNNNQILDPNETWTYTGSHTVIQADLDQGGNLVNMAMADSVESAPSVDHAFVHILQAPELTRVKTDAILDIDSGETWTYRYTRSNCQ